MRGRGQGNVWHFDKPARNDLHLIMKPVALVERAIRNSSEQRDTALDPFTGGIGVVEGNGGLLRAGLPWQSIHDGENYAHEPLRLAVCIEAPRQAMTAILQRHDDVRAFFDNGWMHLLVLDEEGRMAWRYADDLQWTAMSGMEPAEM